jgi:four helix bundle protein
LAEAIYRASSSFAPDERFGLTVQVRRAAISVPSNISEGAARTGTGEFLQFLSVASGSLAELETQLILANRLGMLRAEETERLLEESETVSKMLGGLKRSLLSRRSQPPISP